MEKFSIYDLIGLLFPGYVFVYFCKLLNSIYIAFPNFFIFPDNEIGIGIMLAMALIFGSLLFALNFYLAYNVKWYYKTLGIYKPVPELYLKSVHLHKMMNETLNTKAQEWFGQKIFFNKEEFDDLKKEKQKQAQKLQDDFYSRMYYELEYIEKLENARTVQSFYFFFRQLLTAYLILIIATILLELACKISFFNLNNPELSYFIWLMIFLIFNLCISIVLARWFRKRMVIKMFWAYFSHLNLTNKK